MRLATVLMLALSFQGTRADRLTVARSLEHERTKDMENVNNSNGGVALVPISNVQLPVGVSRYNKAGRSQGTRFSFCGQENARTIKEQGKLLGLKNGKLREYTNAVLTGDKGKASAVYAAAYVADATARGFVWTHADESVKGDGLKLVAQRPTEDKAEKKAAEKVASLEAEKAKLEADKAAMAKQLAELQLKLGIK